MLSSIWLDSIIYIPNDIVNLKCEEVTGIQVNDGDDKCQSLIYIITITIFISAMIEGFMCLTS